MRNRTSCDLCENVTIVDTDLKKNVEGYEMDTCNGCGQFVCEECSDDRSCCAGEIEALQRCLFALRAKMEKGEQDV